MASRLAGTGLNVIGTYPPASSRCKFSRERSSLIYWSHGRSGPGLVCARSVSCQRATIEGHMSAGFILQLIAAAANNPFLQMGAIIGGTFILEDATTILAALGVSDGSLPVWTTLVALYLGIALGDLGLFGLGRLAGRHRWARRYTSHQTVDAARNWLSGRLITAVIAVRFLPGARLPTYTACGLLNVSFWRFTSGVIIGTLVWTTLLFVASSIIGSVLMPQLGALRWVGGAALALAIFASGRWLAVRHSTTPVH